MKKFSIKEFDKLLKQYKALSGHLLEKEKEMLKLYESSTVNGEVTINSDKIYKVKSIKELRETIGNINQEMNKIDKQVLKMFEESKL